MVTAYQLSPCTAVGDQRGLWAIPGSAQGESHQPELPVLCFSGSGAPDFSVLSILARKARRLVLERKEELLTWFCVGWLPMPCCRSCLQPWVNCLGTDVPLWVWAERCYGQMGRWGTKMIWQDLWWRKEHNRHWLKKRKIIVLSSTMLILLFSMKST